MVQQRLNKAPASGWNTERKEHNSNQILYAKVKQDNNYDCSMKSC